VHLIVGWVGQKCASPCFGLVLLEFMFTLFQHLSAASGRSIFPGALAERSLSRPDRGCIAVCLCNTYIEILAKCHYLIYVSVQLAEGRISSMMLLVCIIVNPAFNIIAASGSTINRSHFSASVGTHSSTLQVVVVVVAMITLPPMRRLSSASTESYLSSFPLLFPHIYSFELLAFLAG
jgi:hypothetical protein